MDPDRLFSRYCELQSYVGWTEVDAGSVIVAAAGLLEPLHWTISSTISMPRSSGIRRLAR